MSSIRGHGCSAGSLSPLPSKGGDRTTLEELRLRDEAYARIEHRGSTLRPAHTERERAQPAGRERPRRRLFVGLACRGLPQGAPRMTLPLVPPTLISPKICPKFQVCESRINKKGRELEGAELPALCDRYLELVRKECPRERISSVSITDDRIQRQFRYILSPSLERSDSLIRR